MSKISSPSEAWGFATARSAVLRTVRRRALKFGAAYARQLRRRRPWPAGRWYLVEVFIKIRGETHYLWRAVDSEGEVLDILVE